MAHRHVWATGTPVVYVGTRDREHPDRPRRFDAALDPVTNDPGVTAFPLYPSRIPNLLSDGHDPAHACLYTCVTAMVEAGVHESMEMFQTEPGIPAWDPHDRQFRLSVHVEFADGVSLDGAA